MPRYRAKCVGRSGRRSTLTLDAVDIASFSRHVEGHRKAYVIDVRRVDGPMGATSHAKIPGPMLIAALDSLELMLANGVRVNMALRTLAECAPAGTARGFWTEVVRRVEETGSFGESIRHFPNILNNSMVGVITAHEAAGRLSEGIKQARDYAAQMMAIKREAARGLAYPALVCAIGVAASTVLCMFTLPRFSKMLHDIGVTKTNPLTTFFFGLSDCVVFHPALSALAFAAPFGMAWLALRPRFRPILDRVSVRIPIVRGAVEAFAMARICVTYRALSESGVRVVEALESCMAVAGSVVYVRALETVVSAVRENASVGEGFDGAGIFAPEVVLAIKSGEGSLTHVFERLADYYSSETKHRVAAAVGLIEPAMLVLVLAWVLGIALAVVLPIVEVVNQIH